MSGPILITGAAGFVGGHLVDRLVGQARAPRAAAARGWQSGQIVGWYRPDGDPSTLRRDIEWTAVEMLDAASIDRAIETLQPSVVFHLAAAAHVAQSWQFTLETYQTNVLATHYLFAALSRLGTSPRVLVTCSATIYKPQERPLTEDDPVAPGSPYALSKLAQELLAVRVWNEDRLPVVIARSFNHTGPGQDHSYVASGIARQIALIEAGRQEPTLKLGNLDAERDLSDVRDVVGAYVAMVEGAQPGRIYNVCSGRALSIRALVDTFVARAKTAITIVRDPALLRPNDAPLLVGDHRRLTEDTRWRPEIPLEKTVDDLLDYWRRRIRIE